MSVKKYNLEKIKNDVQKLKEVYVDTIKIAIDKDLVKYLHTLLMLQNFYNKVGIFNEDVNDIIEIKKVEIIYEKTSSLFNQIVMLSEILEEIKFRLSWLEIQIKYDLSIFLININDDNMTDKRKIGNMLLLLENDLNFQYKLDKLDEPDKPDDYDDLDLQDD